MRKLILVVAVVACALSSVLPISPLSAGRAIADGKPNIVLFLLDDTNPMDNRLWNDPALTPAIYDHFVAHGVNFTNAYNDTPLCCPARSTLLTGLHSFNTGVTVNDVRLFQPGESIASELDGQGYDTMLVGKYLNHPEFLTGDVYAANSAPWNVFDIFTSNYTGEDGYFYNYTMTTKDGQVLSPPEHSTQLITERAVAHIAATDPNTPIFTMLSVVDTHLPNLPMPGFENDPRWTACQNMPPWDPPNYNEADVSDKPVFVQNTHPLPYADGWPTATLCEEMLGVDWMVQEVTNELSTDGRLDNTLLIFTTDNGMAWGQHRMSLKEVPYATHLPLYMSWPARWGTNPRTIDEYTSNIDMAPTICAAAGCTLGPYPTGQSEPDGISLLPLLDGTVPNLSRDALLETEWRIHPWAAVRTTNRNSLGLWHYVEYQNGFRELYNLEPDADPWELNNLASDPHYAAVISALHQRLIQLLSEGRVNTAATVKIVQETAPNNPQDFAFSGDFGSFALDDDSNATLMRTKTIPNVAPGDYTISQPAVQGWRLASISCPPSSTVDLSHGSVTVHVQPGQSLVCTFRDTRPRPDGAIAISTIGQFKGNLAYNEEPVKRQTQKLQGAAQGQTYSFTVTVKNRSLDPDSFGLSATSTGPTSISIVVVDNNGADVTAAILGGTYKTKSLAHDKGVTFTVRVTVDALAVGGASNQFVLSARSSTMPTVVDTVRAITTV